MRICLVYDCLFPYTVGGAERWYRNVAERLAARGSRGHLPDPAPVGARRARADRRARAGGDGGAADGALHERGRRRILPPLVFGARRARAPAAPRAPLRRRAHRVLPLLLAARRRRAATAAGLRAGRRLVRGLEPRPTGGSTSAGSGGRVGSARAAPLRPRAPARVLLLAAARRAPARGGPARRGRRCSRACTPGPASRARRARPSRSSCSPGG